MNENDIIALGLGLQSPWEIAGQLLDTEKVPHELRLTVQAQRGHGTLARYAGSLARLMISKR